MKNPRASNTLSNPNQLKLCFVDPVNNFSRDEQYEKRFIENNLNLSNRELAAALQCTLGRVRSIQRRFNLVRSDKENKAIRMKLAEKQRGEQNPNWKNGRSQDTYYYKKRQVQRYPEKIRARDNVYRAIKTGKLKRLPCEICGDPNSEAHHHNGYDKDHVLDVEWLCRKHHIEADKLLKEGTRIEEYYQANQRAAS